MKFRYKDWVVCIDPFYQKLDVPGARSFAGNERNPARAEVLDYKITENKYLDSQAGIFPKEDYLIRFLDGGPDKWIDSNFLELFSGRDGPPFAKRTQ